MNDLISRQAAIDTLNKFEVSDGVGISSIACYLQEEAIRSIDNLPSVQPEPLTLRVNRELTKEEYDKLMQDIKDAPIVQLPSAQPEQRWIPCSERLPEEYGEFLITWLTAKAPKQRFIGFAEGEPDGEWDEQRNRFKFNWHPDDYIMENYPDWRIAAWMPLPEPYKGEQDG